MAVIINLDRPRELRFGHKALKVLEGLTGKTVLEIEEMLISGKVSITMLEQFVYAGLLGDAKEYGENLTIERVEELLDQVPVYVDVINAVGKAFTAAFAGKTEGNMKVPPGEPEQPEQEQDQDEVTTGTNH